MLRPDRGRLVLGLLCIAAGVMPILVALDIVAVDPGQVSAPMWVVAACGAVFVIGGCMAILASHSWANDVLAGALCLSFAAIGTWVALFSSADDFSGGVPFVAHETNVLIGRWVFGTGTLICLAISFYVFKRAARRVGS